MTNLKHLLNSKNQNNTELETQTLYGIKLKRLEDGRLCLVEQQDKEKVVKVVSQLTSKLINEAAVDISKPGIYLLNEVHADYGKSLKKGSTKLFFGESLYYESKDTDTKQSVIKELNILLESTKLLGYDIMNNTDKTVAGIEPKQIKFIPYSLSLNGQLEALARNTSAELINFGITKNGIRYKETVPYRIEKTDNVTNIKLLVALKYKETYVGFLVKFTNNKNSANGLVNLDREIIINDSTFRKRSLSNQLEVTGHGSTYFITLSELVEMAKNPNFKEKVVFDNFELKQAYGNGYIKMCENADIIKFDLGAKYSEFMNSYKYKNEKELKAFALVSNKIPVLGEFLPIKYFKN